MHSLTLLWKKAAKQCGLGTSAILKILSRVNNHTLGKNSPNLVTLIGRRTWKNNHTKQKKSEVFERSIDHW
jgi:hypothetical protein